jgi:hypothetical protein
MALLIQERVKSGGERSVRINPLRTAPNISDLVALLSSQELRLRVLSGSKTASTRTCRLFGPTRHSSDPSSEHDL